LFDPCDDHAAGFVQNADVAHCVVCACYVPHDDDDDDDISVRSGVDVSDVDLFFHYNAHIHVVHRVSVHCFVAANDVVAYIVRSDYDFLQNRKLPVLEVDCTHYA